MVLGGLWHGASWNFVIWGAMHGVALVVHKVWKDLRSSSTLPFGGLLGGALTLWWVLLTWIFFRSADLPMAGRILRAFVFFDAPGRQELPMAALVVVACLGLFEWTARRRELSRRWREMSTGRFTVSYAVAWSVAIAFVPTAYRPFIYFQF
jgi:alginate O-acetyltransferase complex protein AlgI